MAIIVKANLNNIFGSVSIIANEGPEVKRVVDYIHFDNIIVKAATGKKAAENLVLSFSEYEKLVGKPARELPENMVAAILSCNSPMLAAKGNNDNTILKMALAEVDEMVSTYEATKPKASVERNPQDYMVENMAKILLVLAKDNENLPDQDTVWENIEASFDKIMATAMNLQKENGFYENGTRRLKKEKKEKEASVETTEE